MKSFLRFRNFRTWALLLTLLSPQLSHAIGFLIEPMVGYGVGSYEVKASGVILGSSVRGERGLARGLHYGGRAGFTVFHYFFLAFDMDWSNQTITSSDGTTVTSHNVSTKSYGGSLGFETPILPFRGWVGYYPWDSMSDTFLGDSILLKGSALKAGLGVKFFGIIGLNFEYIMHKYTRYDRGSYPVTVKTAEADYRIEAPTLDVFLVSLSLPLRF